MKEASGELSMTLITIIAVGVIVGVFAAFWPEIQEAIEDRWGTFEEEAETPPSTSMIVKNIDLN